MVDVIAVNAESINRLWFTFPSQVSIRMSLDTLFRVFHFFEWRMEWQYKTLKLANAPRQDFTAPSRFGEGARAGFSTQI